MMAACPMCGQMNPLSSATCATCGAKIGHAVRPPDTVRATKDVPQGIGTVQSWKFTLGVGALLVIALVIVVSSGKESVPTAVQETAQNDPHDPGMMQRIKELQAHIEEHPDDPEALLEFANMLYDVRFFDRAATMYERHLTLNPSNADARVDLGTSYFQLSFSDSARKVELISRAETCFLEAIETKPKHQLAHFNLGIIHLHRGDMDGANIWLRKSVAIDPSSEAAQRAQQLLSQHVKNNPS